MRGSRRSQVLASIAAALVLAGVATACSSASKDSGALPTSTSSAAQHVVAVAKTPAQAAQDQLKADGYTLVKHAPEAGRVAFGVNLTATDRYEGVVIVNSQQDATAAQQYYKAHVQSGVTVTPGTRDGKAILTIRADTLKHGVDAFKALVHDAHLQAKSQL